MSFYFSYDADLKPLLDELSLSPEEVSLLYKPNEFHNTVLYSNGEYNKELNKIKLPSLEVEIKAIEVFRNINFNYLVLLLDNKELNVSHNFLKELLENENVQEHFNPHITIQKVSNIEEPLSTSIFENLIGKKVILSGFRCIPIKKKVLENVKVKI